MSDPSRTLMCSSNGLPPSGAGGSVEMCMSGCGAWTTLSGMEERAEVAGLWRVRLASRRLRLEQNGLTYVVE